MFQEEDLEKVAVNCRHIHTVRLTDCYTVYLECMQAYNLFVSKLPADTTSVGKQGAATKGLQDMRRHVHEHRHRHRHILVPAVMHRTGCPVCRTPHGKDEPQKGKDKKRTHCVGSPRRVASLHPSWLIITDACISPAKQCHLHCGITTWC